MADETMNDTETAKPRAMRFRWLPFAIIGATFVFLTYRSAGPVVDPVYCVDETAAQAADVVMLSASWCRYCRSARGFLVSNGVNYCEFDIERSVTGARRYAASPVRAIPILSIRDETLVGFNRHQLEQTLIGYGIKTLDDF